MSATLTHHRGDASVLHPITGEPPGIKEILERRSAGAAPDPDPAAAPAAEPAPATTDDDADRTARELAQWKQRGAEAESRLAEETRRRVEAETAAAQARQGAEDTGFTAISTALAAAEREVDGLKAEMKAAGDGGDFGRVAEIATRLGQLGAETLRLQEGKAEYERSRQTRVADRPAPAQPAADTATERGILRQLGVQSREQFLATRTDATATWLRAHPEFFTDPAMFARVTGADSLAKGRNIAIDTPEYFSLIEREAGLSQTTQPPARRDVQPDARATPSAAPTRDAPGPTGRPSTRPGDVYVSQEDRVAAEWMGVDPQEYAAEKERLKNSGEWPYRRR